MVHRTSLGWDPLTTNSVWIIVATRSCRRQLLIMAKSSSLCGIGPHEEHWKGAHVSDTKHAV